MPKIRTCIVADCDVETTGMRPMCPQHWDMLPGRMRSSLAFTAKCARSPRTDAAWQRACAAISKEARP